MERVVELVEQSVLRKKRQFLSVAAYTRVSSGKDAMLHSLSQQISYYRDYIQSNPEWQLYYVYCDEAITGTKDSRDAFQEMVQECRAGQIDLIITKSISRFARNTVTLLETVRELKSIGVDVYFEEENIHTLSSDGELIITLLACYAQEESRSVSENQKWRVKKNYSEGKLWSEFILGYKQVDNKFVVIPKEAEIVKRIFNEYLMGYGYEKIASNLNADRIKTKIGNEWHPSSISIILHDYKYTGNLILQKSYTFDHITKKKVINRGEFPKYHIENSHEAIIDMDTFEKVQSLIKEKAEKYVKKVRPKEEYPFTKIIRCEKCGAFYKRCTSHDIVFWNCSSYARYGKSKCTGSRIHEDLLFEISNTIASIDKI